MLARSVTIRSKACDERLAHVTSYIHQTTHHRHCCAVGNKIEDCKLRIFQDASVAGDLQYSKSTSGGMLCVFLFPGGARHKQPCLTAVPNQKEFLWPLIGEWEVNQHCNCGIVSWRHFRIPMQRETLCAHATSVILFLILLIIFLLIRLITFQATF